MADPNRLDRFKTFLNVDLLPVIEPNKTDRFRAFVGREQQQIQQKKRNELLGELNGSLPGIEALTVKRSGLPGRRPVQPGESPLTDLILRRQGAVNELERGGMTRQQIGVIQDVQKRTTPPTLGRTIGAIAGEVGLAAAVGALIPAPEEIVTIPMAIGRGLKAIAPIVGGGLGGGFGEAAQVGIEENRLISGREFRNAMLKEAGFTAGGRGVTSALKFAVGPVTKVAVSGTDSFIDDFTRLGGTMPPSQLDKRTSLRLTDELTRGAFGVTDILATQREKGAKAAMLFADNVLDEIANKATRMSETQMAHALETGVQDTAGFLFKEKEALFTRLYQNVDELTQGRRVMLVKPEARTITSSILDDLGRPITTTKEGGKIVGEQFIGVGAPTASLKKIAKKELLQSQRLVKFGRRAKGPLLSPAGREIVRQIDNLPDTIGFGDLQKLRSTWLVKSKQLGRDVDTSQAIVKKFTSEMSKMMRTPGAIQNMTPEARNLLLNTNNLYKATAEAWDTTFNEKVLAGIVKRPGKLPKTLIPNRAPEAVRQLREGLIHPIPGKTSAKGKRLFNQIRQARLAEMIDDAIDLEKGTVNPARFERDLHKFGGEKALKELLPDKQGRDLLDRIRSLLKTMSSKPTGSAALFIKGGQVTGAYALYNGTSEGDILQITAGGLLVFGPRLYVRMAAHPLGNRLLRTGIGLKPGSTAIGPIAARVVNLARQLDREDANVGVKEQKRQAARRQNIVAPPRQTQAFRGGSFR